MGHARAGGIRRVCYGGVSGRIFVGLLERLGRGVGGVMQRFVAKTKRCDRTGKVAYRDEHSGNRAIQNISNISKRDLVPIRAYLCPFCKHWHLTSRGELT